MKVSAHRVASVFLAYQQDNGGGLSDQFSSMLAVLRALAWMYQTAHWQARGPSAYGDHLLFERLYNTVNAEIDVLAEKSVGYLGPDSVDSVVSMHATLRWVSAWVLHDDLVVRMLQAESDLLAVFQAAYEDIKQHGAMTLGLDDWIMGTASAHETNTYLLQQRASGLPRVASEQTAEGYFGLSLENHSVRDFAQSRALTNDTSVAKSTHSTPAPIPTPKELRNAPGDDAFRTLNRFVVNTAEPISDMPKSRSELRTHAHKRP